MAITGKTKVYGLIGNPTQKSISPLLQNNLFCKRGYDFVYVTFPVTENVQSAIEGAYSLNIQGLNVTCPHKEAVIPHLKSISEHAKAINSVNTLKRNEFGYDGYNTDIFGLEKSFALREIELKNSTALIIGAGGTARSAAYTLAKNGAKEIFIVNRTKENANYVASIINEYYNIPVSVFTFENVNSIQKGDIIIQTTSVGFTDDENPFFYPEIVNEYNIVFDVIYSPWESSFLRMAKRLNKNVFNGFDMLIYQGLKSYEIWTGDCLSDEYMKITRNEIRQLLKYQ